MYGGLWCVRVVVEKLWYDVVGVCCCDEVVGKVELMSEEVGC